MAQITGRIYKRTAQLRGVEFDDPALSTNKIFFSTSWLRGHGIGTEINDIVVITVSNAGEVDDPIADEDKIDTEEAPPQETSETDEVNDNEQFAAFLKENVVAALGGRLASGHLWSRWADMHDADPADSPIRGYRQEQSGVAHPRRARPSSHEEGSGGRARTVLLARPGRCRQG